MKVFNITKKRTIYFAILFVMLLIICVSTVSFAWFFKSESIKNINIIAGNLTYTLQAEELTNNRITIESGEKLGLLVTLTSNNTIETNYEMYYNLITPSQLPEGFSIEYMTMKGSPSKGSIDSLETIQVFLQINNETTETVTLELGVQGGLINKELVMNKGNAIESATEICMYAPGTEWVFNYSGTSEEFVVPCSGTYKLEVWGAQGGSISSYIGGYGGYSVGEVNLSTDTSLFVAPGGAGSQLFTGGYNGGGTAAYYQYGGSGGGATHIATGKTNRGELYNYEDYKDEILIVAGGGGAANYRGGGYGQGNGGNAGGYIGNSGATSNFNTSYGYGLGYGGTQSLGGSCLATTSNIHCKPGVFGKADSSNTPGIQSGGGGGYYGGGSAEHGGGGGGSSYVGNPLLGETGVMYCSSCATTANPGIVTERASCVQADPVSKCAKTGNGYAKITLLEIDGLHYTEYKTPLMTSNTTCADDTNPLCGTVTASQYRENRQPYMAFDGVEDILTGWNSTQVSTSAEVGKQYIMYEFKDIVYVTGYDFYVYNIGGHGMYYNFDSNITIEVSTDGKTWTTVQTTVLSPGQKHSITFDKSYSAKYFKLTIDGRNSYFSYDANWNWVSITEMSITALALE